ncbi:MAG: 50S ribosomal protein L1 [Candidatus Woesearchaeota archaeon]
MEYDKVLEAIKKAKESSNKRNFEQRIDLTFNFKELDLKKPDHQLDFFMTLPNIPGKPKRVSGFVDTELIEEAKNNLEFYITPDKFAQYKDKKAAKKLANSYDYFIAQATLMKDIAASFGRILGSRGKMPNPKAGMVVPPRTQLAPLIDRLKKTVHVKVKTSPVFHSAVGSEKQADDEIATNIMYAYEQIVSHLPQESKNIKSVYIKTTMGFPIKVI